MAEQETKSQQVSESDPTHIDNLMDMLGAGSKKSQAQEQSASQEDGKPKLTATHQGWQYFSDGTGERQLKKVGRSLQEVFLRKTPALGILIRKIKDLAEQVGYLPGLDGRRVPVRSAHSAFNALLQSAGAVLCKRWLADADDALRAEGLVKGWSGDYVILGWIHDEIQIACRDGHQDTVGRLLTSTACSAGSSYGFRIPLASTYKVGRTWAGTH